MRNSGVVGAGMFGGGGRSRPLNTFAWWQYALIALTGVLSLIYALPNLYPPDFAIQISPVSPDGQVTTQVLTRAAQVLDAAKVGHFGDAVVPRAATLRVHSGNDQLRAQRILADALRGADGRDEYVVALNLAPSTPRWLGALGGRPMKYGLDLSGGVHLLYEVDMEAAMKTLLESYDGQIRAQMREKRMRYRSKGIAGEVLRFEFPETQYLPQARQLLTEQFSDFAVTAAQGEEGPALHLKLKEKIRRDRETYAIEQNLLSLRNRVNELGVSEPLVQRLGRSRIVVDLPGLQDSSEAKNILGKIANLEFRLNARPETAPSEVDPEAYEYEGRPQTLERANIVTGDNVTNALQDFDPQSNQPQVSITLGGDGGRRMYDATKDNIGHPMAILYIEQVPRVSMSIVDGKEVKTTRQIKVKKLISVATIQAALGNRFRITGLSMNEARQLALLLRAGALAAPMQLAEERTVGASLGAENVQKGLIAGLIGTGLVVVFMVVNYHVFGLLADLALVMNVMMLIAVMSLFGVTLTLPGIAGIALTIGMAVDANVLIFCRIREELDVRPVQQAIHAGFDRAFTTIWDSNATTLIVAGILFLVGSGPVKGFAVTLSIGIITSMFTAVTVTRGLVNVFYGGRAIDKLVV